MFSQPGTGAKLLRQPNHNLPRGGIGHPEAGYVPSMSLSTMAIEMAAFAVQMFHSRLEPVALSHMAGGQETDKCGGLNSG